MRNLKNAAGEAIGAEPAFAALRDRRPTSIAAIEGRRAAMEEIFARLEQYGIERTSLVLAFDFIVQSEHQLTHQMLSMRDQGFTDLAPTEENPNFVNFNVSSVEEHDCQAPGEVVWRDVAGTFRVPLFLTSDPDEPGAPVLNVNAGDVPFWSKHTSAPFFVSIPCSVFDSQIVSRPLLLGHGAFGSGLDMTTGIPPLVAGVTEWTYIAGATDWRGLSRSDLNWLLENIVGSDGTSKFNNFPALPDRIRQGMANTLILGRMMKAGIFNRAEAFQTPDGKGVFPGPEEELYYYGVSLGGILGTYLAAVTPDIERFALEVPTINFIGCLTQRSTQFGAFVSVLAAIGLDDPMQTALFLNLLHEVWVSAEPAGYARHITTDPLPGSGGPKRLLYRPAWLDKQVPNQCSEISVRTLGLSNLEGSIVQRLQGIPDVTGPQDSGMVMYDTGSFDLFDPLQQPFIPPLGNLVPDSVCDPHGATRRIPAAIEQLVTFLQPGGRIENFCEGDGNLCDADRPFEIADGASSPCDPLAAP
jgi:pimeloyl-ACP methyl ester carboxylesterase